jgi:hypothetical protein
MSLMFMPATLVRVISFPSLAIRIGAGAEAAEAMTMLITRTLERIGP